MTKRNLIFFLFIIIVSPHLLWGNELDTEILGKSTEIFYNGFDAKNSGKYKKACELFGQAFLLNPDLSIKAKAQLLESVLKWCKPFINKKDHRQVDKILSKYDTLLQNEPDFCLKYGFNSYYLANNFLYGSAIYRKDLYFKAKKYLNEYCKLNFKTEKIATILKDIENKLNLKKSINKSDKEKQYVSNYQKEVNPVSKKSKTTTFQQKFKNYGIGLNLGVYQFTGEAQQVFKPDLTGNLQFIKQISRNFNFETSAGITKMTGKSRLKGRGGYKYCLNACVTYKFIPANRNFYGGTGLLIPWIKIDDYSKIGYGGLVKAGYRFLNYDIFIQSTYESADSVNWGGITAGLGIIF